jgi:hypothetical protein
LDAPDSLFSLEQCDLAEMILKIVDAEEQRHPYPERELDWFVFVVMLKQVPAHYERCDHPYDHPHRALATLSGSLGAPSTEKQAQPE